MTCLPKWPIFTAVPESLKKAVCHVLPYGSDALLFIVRDQDSLHLYRTTINSQQGDCIKVASFTNRDGFDVVDVIVSPPPETFYVLINNSLSAWGSNGCAQAGSGQTALTVGVSVAEDSQHTVAYLNEQVEQIACGNGHAVCLTKNGKVFCWGRNNFGQAGEATGEFVSKPSLIDSDETRHLKFVQVACCHDGTVALDSNGSVFVWGSVSGYANDFGGHRKQLPTKVVIQDVNIKQIACGSKHVLALAENGSLYSWGMNDFGQLGCASIQPINSPTQITAFDSPRVKFESILCNSNKNISIARSLTGDVFVWGETRSSRVTNVPVKLPHVSLLKAFCDWTVPPLILPSLAKVDAMHLAGEAQVSPLWLRKAFDNPAFSDVKFIITNRPIHAHRIVLTARSSYFSYMFNQEWKEPQVEIENYSYDVYRVLIQYMYTGETEIPDDLAQIEVISLYDLASRCSEDELKDKVSKFFLRKWLKLECVLANYAMAADHPMKEVADACMELILENLSSLVKTEQFRRLHSKHAKTILLRSADRNLLKN